MAQKKNAPKAAKAEPAAAAVKAQRTRRAAAKTAAKPAVAAKARRAPTRAKAAAKPQPALVSPVAAAAAVAANATNQINERTNEMQNEATQKVAENAQALFGDINERAKTAVERSARVLEEMTDLTRGNVEAIVASSKVAARGVETLSQEAAEFGRKSFEEASSAVRTFAEVRSATDFFRLQSEFAKTQFDSMVAESSKMSEAVIKLAGEVIEPITSRYSVAAERVKSLAA
jgi:phasin family protein